MPCYYKIYMEAGCRLRSAFVVLAAYLLFAHVGTLTLHAQSQSELDKKTWSAFVETDVAFSVHRSDSLRATDFGSELGFSMGAWTGKKEVIGLGINYRINQTKFTHADSSMKTTWTDYYLMSRLFWFYPKLTFGSCSVFVIHEGDKIADGLCTTVGGGLDTHVPIGNYIVLNVDTQFSSILQYRDSVSNENNLGQRSDVGMGVWIYPKLTWLKILAGYRYRFYSLTVDGATNREVETGPYTGVSVGYDF